MRTLSPRPAASTSKPACGPLAVIQRAGSWTLYSSEGAGRRFDHKVDAEEAALRLQSRARGGPVVVLVQSAAGELEVLRG